MSSASSDKPPDGPFRIGVISDTHNFLDSNVSNIFAGVDHILHGGDVGLPAIINELETIAPVTAVLGNTDYEGQYKEVERVELAGRKFLLQHIVDPRYPDEILQGRLSRFAPDVVIFGHTHKPFAETINGTLFFNPGYAGKQRFKLARSVAVLTCESGEISWRYHEL